jgi:thiamine-monophosphate kinase
MEHAFIAWAKRKSLSLKQPKLGIGDDAAILEATDSDTVVTTDTICDGSHFRLAECGGRAVGHKVAGVNLSDMASMAAIPTDMFLTLCLPRSHPNTSQLAVDIFEGVYEYAERYQVSIAGGDTNVWDGPLVVSITIVGRARSKGCWLRSGAKAGDWIVVTGSLGGSILGRHLAVEPRLDIAAELYDRISIHAATDVSDGLGVDLLSIFTSSGCGAEVDLSKIPISTDAYELAKTSNKSPLQHALGDGEDFELILAVPDSQIKELPDEVAGVSITKIGRFISRTGLWSREGGKVKQLPPNGYVHRV